MKIKIKNDKKPKKRTYTIIEIDEKFMNYYYIIYTKHNSDEDYYYYDYY